MIILIFRVGYNKIVRVLIGEFCVKIFMYFYVFSYVYFGWCYKIIFWI